MFETDEVARRETGSCSGFKWLRSPTNMKRASLSDEEPALTDRMRLGNMNKPPRYIHCALANLRALQYDYAARTAAEPN